MEVVKATCLLHQSPVRTIKGNKKESSLTITVLLADIRTGTKGKQTRGANP